MSQRLTTGRRFLSPEISLSSVGKGPFTQFVLWSETFPSSFCKHLFILVHPFLNKFNFETCKTLSSNL